MNPEEFTIALREKGINLTEYQLKQFYTYFHSLVEWNEKVNLTSLTSEADVYLKHFFDSISVAFYYNFTKEMHICDVGAGAGFPSIPLKICFPHLKISIVDSLQKRIGFLEHLKDQLKIDDISFYHSRAEDFGKKVEFRESFDLVIARAVARLSVLSELCIPLVKVQGVFIAMKGAQADEEVEKGKLAVKTLGGKIENIQNFSLPHEKSERSIIIINKEKRSPKKYPRKSGTPNKNPIE